MAKAIYTFACHKRETIIILLLIIYSQSQLATCINIAKKCL